MIYRKNFVRLLLLSLSISCMFGNASSYYIDPLTKGSDIGGSGYWSGIGEADDFVDNLPLDIDVHTAFIFNLDKDNFQESLNSEFRYGGDGEVELPLSNGKSLRLNFFERSNFAPELAQKYPDIKSFRGYAIDYPHILAYLSTSSLGIDATMINTSSGKRTYIHQISNQDKRYVAYTDFERSEDLSLIHI